MSDSLALRLIDSAAGPLRTLGSFGAFVASVLRSFVALRWSPAEVIDHAATVASRCFLPVMATIAPFGAVIGVQGMVILELFSAERLLSSLLAMFVVRELGPVLAAVLVAAQGGSSFAAELGAMRIQEELDATAVMAVDPIGWHVVPRVLAMGLVVPMLTTVANAFGILGCWVVAVGVQGQAHGVFMSNIATHLSVYDLGASALKGLVYGLLVGLLAAWKGFNASGGAEGVGRAVNDTVVASVMFILVFNYILSTLLFSEAST